MELLFNGALLHWNYFLTTIIMKNTLAWIAFIVATAFATISLFLPPQAHLVRLHLVRSTGNTADINHQESEK